MGPNEIVGSHVCFVHHDGEIPLCNLTEATQELIKNGEAYDGQVKAKDEATIERLETLEEQAKQLAKEVPKP